MTLAQWRSVWVGKWGQKNYNPGMELFAVSDLHLSLASDKPMDIFGEHWRGHDQRLAEAWDQSVGPHDLVLCPGDLSWAMRLADASQDLRWIGDRPGIKVLGRGNHDYWWSAISKVRAALPESCLALQNDAQQIGQVVVAGSRLWPLPGSSEFGQDDEKIYKRELLRLEMSLQAAQKLAGDKLPIIASVHYPPFTSDGASTPYTDLLQKYSVSLCVYGHLHGEAGHATAVEGLVNGVEYALVACDYLDFAPKKLSGLL